MLGFIVDLSRGIADGRRQAEAERASAVVYDRSYRGDLNISFFNDRQEYVATPDFGEIDESYGSPSPGKSVGAWLGRRKPREWIVGALATTALGSGMALWSLWHVPSTPLPAPPVPAQSAQPWGKPAP